MASVSPSSSAESSVDELPDEPPSPKDPLLLPLDESPPELEDESLLLFVGLESVSPESSGVSSGADSSAEITGVVSEIRVDSLPPPSRYETLRSTTYPSSSRVTI